VKNERHVWASIATLITSSYFGSVALAITVVVSDSSRPDNLWANIGLAFAFAIIGMGVLAPLCAGLIALAGVLLTTASQVAKLRVDRHPVISVMLAGVLVGTGSSLLPTYVSCFYPPTGAHPICAMVASVGAISMGVVGAISGLVYSLTLLVQNERNSGGTA